MEPGGTPRLRPRPPRRPREDAGAARRRCRSGHRPPPEERYADVDALARDVSHYLAALPVTAYPEGLFERLGRLAVRYRTPLLLVLAYLLMRLLLLVFARS